MVSIFGATGKDECFQRKLFITNFASYFLKRSMLYIAYGASLGQGPQLESLFVMAMSDKVYKVR